MSDFRAQLERFTVTLEQRQKDVFVGCATGIKQSVTDGLAATGAPGQPVDTGNLKGSWQLMYESADVAVIATNVEYAPYIEEGVSRGRAMTLRSRVGGFHSVALTRANFDKLAEDVVREVVK